MAGERKKKENYEEEINGEENGLFFTWNTTLSGNRTLS